jgi:hypothetical protein
MTAVHLGGCACGAVRYRTAGLPIRGVVCHCTFCQRRLASAFAVLVSFPETAVDLLQGTPCEIDYRSDESGRWLRMAFCGACGTTVYHTAELRPGVRTIAAGTFDDPGWFAIDMHIWTRSKQGWVTIPDGVLSFPQGFVPPPAPGDPTVP